MDINTLGDIVAQDEKPVEVTVYQKNGDPYLGPDDRPCIISVVGSESKQYRAARDKLTRKFLRGRQSKMEPADLRNNRVEQAAAAVVGWSGWTAHGLEFPATPENVRILLNQADHILEQVEAGINSHADFFTNSSLTSPTS